MIYRFNKYIFFFIIFFLCIPSVVIGADKPTLRVNFEIKEENYRDSFGEQITLIEKEINEVVATFIETEASYRVVCKLGDSAVQGYIHSLKNVEYDSMLTR